MPLLAKAIQQNLGLKVAFHIGISLEKLKRRNTI